MQLMPLSSVGLGFSLPLIVAGWNTRSCILAKPLVLPTNRLLLPSFPRLAAGIPAPLSLLLLKRKSADVFRFQPLLSLH